MKHLVLGIGYPAPEYEMEQSEWDKYGIEFHFADNISQATKKMRQAEYVCIAIRSDCIAPNDLILLRETYAIPIVILPSFYTVAERYTCVHLGAIQYARTTGYPQIAETGGEGSLRHYLDTPTGERKPLTIITVKDLSFCLEYRSVEVKGQEIDLTAKEFDILALLIMNQRRVFTYEMIMELVWKEGLDNYSRKAIVNHISNLRKKLKTSPDMPDYIKSVHNIGYKFDVR